MTTRLSRPAPKLAVIVPLHKQPGLVIEALESVLAQRDAPPLAAILVVDGCPMPESDRVCARYVLAHPGRVLALHQQHRGLSAARNAGVRSALAAWPALESVYFLDADNRLEPRALARLWAALQSGADWAYPDIDMIGMAGNYDYGGRYSPLNHLAENVCEAGSLVHRRVFEAGVWFDETMRDGYEDWDFWQRAAARGYRGVHAPWAGFRYRRRPESMLAGSDRMREALVGALTRSERACWRVGRALALEHAETPRYAVIVPGEDAQVGLVTDVRRWKPAMPRAAFAGTVAAWASDPRRFRCPPYVAALERAWLDSGELRARLPGLLWRAEEIADAGAWAAAGEGFAFIATARLLADAPLGAPVSLGSGGAGKQGAADAAATLQELHRSLAPTRATPLRPWSWRVSSTRPSSAAHLGLRHLAGGGPVLPLVEEKPALALIASSWPAERFTGAAEAALALEASGWALHLMITGERAQPDARFASVTFLGEPAIAEPPAAAGPAYFGAALPALWSRADRQERLVGLFAGMDAVLNLGLHSLSAVMGRLAALGVRRWLALPEEGADAETGLALAFEHCYDGVLARAPRAAELARGGGIPAAKLEASFP